MDISNAVSSLSTPMSSLGRDMSAATLPANTPAPAAPMEVPEVAVQPASRADVEQAAENITRYLQENGSSLNFSIDDESGRVIMKIIDPSTDEVIRQFPSEDALSISKSLDKLQGLLLRDKA